MSKMIQVRDVPEEIHAVLKSRAALEGMSLSDFLKRELEQLARRPSLREWLESSRQLKRIGGSQSAAEVIRQMRDER
jgi:plasmid stability protein